MNKFAKRQAAIEKKYLPVFLKRMKQMNAYFLSIAEANGLTQAIQRVDVLITPLPYKPVMIDLYKKAAIPQAREAYNDTKRQAFKFTGMGRDELWIADIVRFIEQNGLDKLTQSITDTQKKVLLKIIQQGIDEGKSFDQIVQDIEQNDVWVINARRIARTESVRAMNFGHMLGGASLTFEVDKIWNSSQDRRTRGADAEDQFDHYHMDLQRVGYNEPFHDSRRNEKLQFPGDPNASPGNTINCRCRVTFEPIRKDGKLIPKKPTTPNFNQLLYGLT